MHVPVRVQVSLDLTAKSCPGVSDGIGGSHAIVASPFPSVALHCVASVHNASGSFPSVVKQQDWKVRGRGGCFYSTVLSICASHLLFSSISIINLKLHILDRETSLHI